MLVPVVVDRDIGAGVSEYFSWMRHHWTNLLSARKVITTPTAAKMNTNATPNRIAAARQVVITASSEGYRLPNRPRSAAPTAGSKAETPANRPLKKADSSKVEIR
jgi:hypothetical protein